MVFGNLGNMAEIMKQAKKDPSIHKIRYLNINEQKSPKDYYSQKIFKKLGNFYKKK